MTGDVAPAGTNPTTDTRMALVRKFERLTHVPAAGFPLSVWAGRDRWATASPARRDKSGHRALTELDTMIEQLTELREQLNDQLALAVTGATDTHTQETAP